MDVAISPFWRARDVILVVSEVSACTAILGPRLTRLWVFVAGPIMEHFFDGVERNWRIKDTYYLTLEVTTISFAHISLARIKYKHCINSRGPGNTGEELNIWQASQRLP